MSLQEACANAVWAGEERDSVRHDGSSLLWPSPQAATPCLSAVLIQHRWNLCLALNHMLCIAMKPLPVCANTAIFFQLGDPELRSYWRGRWNSIQTSCCDKTVSRGLLHLRYKKQKAFCQPCRRWMLPHLKALCIGGEDTYLNMLILHISILKILL